MAFWHRPHRLIKSSSLGNDDFVKQRVLCGTDVWKSQFYPQRKNMKRVAKETLNPGALSDISNVNLDLYTGLHVCYIVLKFFKIKIAFGGGQF